MIEIRDEDIKNNSYFEKITKICCFILSLKESEKNRQLANFTGF